MVLLVLFAVALAARVLVGALFADPAYPDSYYYVNVARELAAGNGFQVGYIWNFVDVGGRVPETATLPIPSNAHWMPLGALVQVPFIWALGPTALASAMPFWIVGALAAPLAYLIAADAGLGRGVGITAGLLTGVPAAVTPFMAQPDNFGLYMTLGALALWLAARTLRGDRRALVLGGLTVGLAMLARNDGLLLGVPLALAALVAIRRSQRPRRDLAAMIGSGGLFLVAVGPWLLRQLVTFGSLSPSAASGRILWLTDYDQLWSVGEAPTASGMLEAGVPALLASRLDGLAATATIMALAPLALVLVPFAVIGAWRHRRDAFFAPFFGYAALLVGTSALLFAVHVRYGMFLHSLVALLPHIFVLVAVGIGMTTDWIAARRATWQPGGAAAAFRAGAVAVALLVGLLQTTATVDAWQASGQPRRELAGALSAIPAGERVMSADPGALDYLYGIAGVVTPNDPLPVIEGVARAYGARWLVLERGGIVPALQPVLRGELRPAWISAPLVELRQSSTEVPSAALYAICTTTDDARCEP